VCTPRCKEADSGRRDLTAVKVISTFKESFQEQGERLVEMLPKEDTVLLNTDDQKKIYSLLQEKHEAFALSETEQG